MRLPSPARGSPGPMKKVAGRVNKEPEADLGPELQSMVGNIAIVQWCLGWCLFAWVAVLLICHLMPDLVFFILWTVGVKVRGEWAQYTLFFADRTIMKESTSIWFCI